MNNLLLTKLYYDKSSPWAYTSEVKLWKEAKKHNPKITLKDVKNWAASQNIPSRFALAKKKFHRATFITHEANDTWAADLADFSKMSKHNKGYKWLLLIQDIFSRKLKALVAQKTKTAKETAKSLDKIFSIEKPKTRFFTDKGNEFKGECRQIYAKFGIEHYTTNDAVQKASTAERALLVVKQRLFKIMAKEHTFTWTDKLDEILRVYNKSYNRNLGMTPTEAESAENRSKVFYNTVIRSEVRKGYKNFTFKVGDVVRILLDKKFGKSYTGNYSNVLYEIYARERRSGALVYLLKELLTGEKVKGSFYSQELRPVFIDKTKLPKVDQIYGFRIENDVEYVRVKLPGENRQKWVAYDTLIPY